MKTSEILGSYLAENSKTHLGGSGQEIELSPSDQKLLDSLSKKVETNKVLIYAIFIVLILILFLSFYFIFYYKNDPKTIIMLLSGTSLSTFGVVARMHRVWIDKYKLDILSSSFPFLSNSERIKIVMSLCRIEDKSLFNFSQQSIRKTKT